MNKIIFTKNISSVSPIIINNVFFIFMYCKNIFSLICFFAEIAVMATLVPKSRVSWGIVVVEIESVKSLHLIKKGYRGDISYYSSSAGGLVDKVGFGEVR